MNANQVEEIANHDTKLALIKLRILVLDIQCSAVEELLDSTDLSQEDRDRALDALREYTETLCALKKQKVRLEASETKDGQVKRSDIE